MIDTKHFLMGLGAILVTNILCFYMHAEIVVSQIEKHSKHPDYGNIQDASDNQYKNRKSLYKKISCSPVDSCY